MRCKKVVRKVGMGALALGMLGCVPKLIPGTLVDDTKENRTVAFFFKTYKAAVEGRDVDQIMHLVAPDYQDTKKHPDGRLIRYDRSVLQDRLRQDFDKVKMLSLQIYLERIDKLPKQKVCWDEEKQACDQKTSLCQTKAKRVCGKKRLFGVTYRYVQHTCFDLPVGEKCRSSGEVNRVRIRQRGKKPSGGFEIVAGGL